MERIKIPKEKVTIEFKQLEIAKVPEALSKMASDFDIKDPKNVFDIVKKDKDRLNEALKSIKSANTQASLESIFGKKSKEISTLANKVKYDHEALLLVSDPDIVSSWLSESGFKEGPCVPSVNVVLRLQQRWGVASPVAIWRAGTEIADPDLKSKTVYRQVELFLPSPQPKAWNENIIYSEQTKNHESHTAFTTRGEAKYEDVVNDFIRIGMSLDGDMTINFVENSSTQYFRNNRTNARLELIRYGVV